MLQFDDLQTFFLLVVFPTVCLNVLVIKRQTDARSFIKPGLEAKYCNIVPKPSVRASRFIRMAACGQMTWTERPNGSIVSRRRSCSTTDAHLKKVVTIFNMETRVHKPESQVLLCRTPWDDGLESRMVFRSVQYSEFRTSASALDFINIIRA